MEKASEKLIIALDGLDYFASLALVEKTLDYAKTFKVGLDLFYREGPKIISDIKSLGVDVFLDLKLHDIPMQVGQALEHIIKLSPRFITLHALGGQKMLTLAHSMLLGTNITPLAVSLLTSHDEEEIKVLGFLSIKAQVRKLLSLAKDCGINSFVASAKEASMLKSEMDCFLVCPGIRSHELGLDDQTRIMDPYQAILAGADAIVVGRPITKAKDPRGEASFIHNEISRALEKI